MPYLIILFVALIAVYLVLRKKNGPKPSVNDLKPIDYKTLLAHVSYYQKLDEAGKTRFEKLVYEFLQDTNIEGVGTDVTDLDRALIASSAVIPIFGFPDWKYKDLTNVILYPDTFDKEFQFEGENRDILGMVGSGYMNGQMLLSRGALTAGFSKSAGAGNAAIHEFVHLLDKADGETDGVPEYLMAHEYAVPWLKMMHHEMHRIKEGHSDINPYALTNEAEFLAVAAEYFFEKPDQLKHKHPEIYELLSKAFGQDLAG
jgi:Mlc titration factor MtfA (ptsG expression regulator)